MRFSPFVKQCELIQSRLENISKQTAALSATSVADSLSNQQLNKIKLFSIAASQKYSEYEKLVNKLYSTSPLPDDLDDDQVSKLQETISDLFVTIQSTCSTLLPQPASKVSLDDSNASISASASPPTTVKLPPLNLGTFSGQPDQWMCFYGLFENAVHNNTALSNIEKFTYLLSCLSDEPLSLIKFLPVNTANYVIAWQTLTDRYHNTRLLIMLHTNNLLDLPQLNKPSVKQLRKFISSYNENYQALKALGHDVANESLLLTSHMLRKLEPELRSKFEQTRTDSKVVPNITELIKFLENECTQQEAVTLTSMSNKTFTPLAKSTPTYTKSKPSNVLMIAATSSDASQICSYCNSGGHIIYKCHKFTALGSKERFTFIKEKNLCRNCFGSHKTEKCRSTYSCRTCFKRHHTLLHFGNEQQNFTQTKSNEPSSSKIVSHNSAVVATQPSVQDNQSATFVGVTCNSTNTVLLATALVQVASQEGNYIVVRAVLDSASQTTLITESCASLLNAKRSHASLPNISGVSASQVKPKGFVFVKISSLSGNTLVPHHPALVLDTISNELPRAQVTSRVKALMSNYVLADPTFDTPGPVDMLIGADLFPMTIIGTPISLGDNMPYIVNTIFGYVALGSAPLTNALPSFSGLTTLLSTQLELHTTLKRFWSIEEPPQSVQLSPLNQECENHFKLNHSRDQHTGKYICRLPFKDDPAQLGDSSSLAKQMFTSLEKKFINQPELKQKYVEFMRDYAESTHMTPCEVIPTSNSKPHYFIPHHGIFKGDKLRVVFNASAKTSTGVSLNDIQHQGPKLHNDICDIVFHFRQYKIVFSCDIKQMFRNILIHADDQPFQLIYWRENPQETLKVYQLTTVTYGLASSPFLANKVIRQLIADEGSNHPLATNALNENIFVDDVLVGADSLNEAQNLKTDIINLMKKAGFELRKWSSNCSELLQDLPQDHCETPLLLQGVNQPYHSILGIKWNPQSDDFSYFVRKPLEVFTKRTVLSTIAQIYDPIGLLSPLVFWAKAFMQHLWCLGLDWDSILPETVSEKWMKFIKELPQIECLKIPRYLQLSHAYDIQLHAFADASELGFAACVYLRVVNSENEVSVCLLIAKSKVAPLKKMTIPRLELCAAHLLSHLLHYCVNQLSKNWTINSMYAWSDSTVTLSWIRTPSYRLKLFVGNRVAQIQELIPTCTWKHISTNDNPADCASRGLTATAILHHELWWSGPKWLKNDPSSWPTTAFSPSKDSETEMKNEEISLISTEEKSSDFLRKFSSWETLIRVVAYVLRFINCLKSKKKIVQHITQEELKSASTQIFAHIQRTHFTQEIKTLKQNNECSTRIQRLAPFLDDDGLIRVGGRLKNSKLTYGAKYPILLPKDDVIVHNIIDYYHKKYLHAGPLQLQSILQQKFWILSSRRIIRSRIFKCIRCFKTKPTTTSPLMGDLPAGRVTPTRCFEVSAVDFAGPYTLRVQHLRRLQSVKAYLCLFICFSTKAVHLELVSDLSADAFVAALTRFISRRGRVVHLHCDNGTNFVGGSSSLKQCFRELMKKPETQRFADNHQINFHFNPPRAPHQGGLWERAIKSAKHHLIRVIGEQILTYEEFLTLIARVESMLNSRPITPLSSDPSDLEALTPGHFLTGGPLVSLIEPHLTDVPTNRLKRWKMVQAFSQHIWKRWNREYLQNLQERSKWTTSQTNLEVGDLVVIHEDNTPPLAWKLGRVAKLHPGQDNIVRVVEVKTASRTLVRPVVKLSRLPIDQ